MQVALDKAGKISGEYTPPPDKSISHRAVMFSAISRGRSVVRNFLRSGDTLSTAGVFRAMGVGIEDKGGELVIEGPGLNGLREPRGVLDCGNSGTTMRLMSGLLSGLPFFSVMQGDESLTGRPMRRVIDPLRLMGAHIIARDGDKYPPIAIRGGGLVPIRYEMPVASAQVKSSVMLAGLLADGTTTVVEKVKSRDHTERMLPHYGARVRVNGLEIEVEGPAVDMRGREMTVPGDFSSAAFFIAAALIVPGSELMVYNTGLNPTRKGLLDILGRMGAQIELTGEREVSGEPVADLLVRHSKLRAVTVGEEEVPGCIDEFPILTVLCAMAEGRSEIRGAGELRVKESDRIAAMASELRRMGVELGEYEDGLWIEGGRGLRGALVHSHGDHRIAMSTAVAALAAEGTTRIDGADAVSISYPGFFDDIRGICRGGNAG